jgi:probable HAF family extracellular repeat protein
MKIQTVIGRVSIFLTATIAALGQQSSTKPLQYTIHDLGTLGGESSMAYYVNDFGVVSGQAALSNGTNHASLWYQGAKLDIGTPGLAAPSGSAALNSTSFSVNNFGQAVGAAESPKLDPNNENFCSYGTGHTCAPFVWQLGFMARLPGLGGPNGQAISINSVGEAVGVAETNSKDLSCAAVTASQVLDYKGVRWNLSQGKTHVLAPLSNDTISVGLWINDRGQAVGQSGMCDNTTLPPLVIGPHAALWEKDGTVRNLGNLGGECLSPCVNPLLGPIGNTPLYITDDGKVVGASVLEGEQTMHAFLWSNKAGQMEDLNTIPGDIASVALAINDTEGIVGISFQPDGTPRAFLRKHGQMLDLNALVQANAPIYALVAQFINSRGQIAGFGADTSTGAIHAFLATPSDSDSNVHWSRDSDESQPNKMVLSEDARKQLRQLVRGVAFGSRH